ncbi:sterol desaturase family protein [Pseudoalteromonas sp. MMG013]|uniref:sterol desaturase family protein n=1 Tax=Pseudoalteromonas sp. MMG013 TaxID=2822687 RepID=UPI001B376289|nr:sterol desaturase family protein [Pseudoalteromonas sp. MMG013]MBQ4860919.1 sterol desaturase family protein [Pseudoalteromonas sp. MMG013]
MKVEYILILLSPVFITAIVLERLKLKNKYSLKELCLNVSLALSHQIVDMLVMILLMPVLIWLHLNFSLFSFEVSFLAVLPAFVLQDFLYYWFHRASHQCAWLWSAHVVHHSSLHMNFSTALRQSLFYPLTGMWLFWIPLILIGYPPQFVFSLVALNLAFQFFIHTEIVPELKYIGSIFNTPRHHCIHHATNPHCIDKNYAGVLIIWDKLFGTFQTHSPNEVLVFGVNEHRYSMSFLDVVFTPWGILFNNLKKQKNVRNIIKTLFGAPLKHK